MPLNEDTDRLLRDFLLAEERRTADIDRKSKSASDTVLRALDSFGKQLRGELGELREGLEKRIDVVGQRADEAARIAMSAHLRIDSQEKNASTSHHVRSTIYELGDDSPTGSHLVISKEVLDELETKQKAAKWSSLTSNITAVAIGAIALVVGTFLCLKFLGVHP